MIDRLLAAVTSALAELARRPGLLLATSLALNALLLPYSGIDNDAILYSFQVENAGSGRHGGDLFFRYGDQGTFTLVPAALAAPAWGVGVRPVFFLAYLLANAARIAATQRLVLRLLGPTPAAAAGLLLNAAAPVVLGCLMLGANETFFTARTPALALATLGLERVLAGRWWQAAGLLALGLLTHPLITTPAVLVAGAVWVWGWTASGPRCAAVLGAAAGGAGLVAVILTADTLDPEWVALVRAHNRCVDPTAWLVSDWIRMTVAAGLVVTAAARLSGRARWFLGAALAVAAAGLVIAIAAMYGTSALVFQGQAFRWVWPLEVVRWPVGMTVVARLWAAGPTGRVGAVGLFAVLTGGPDLCQPVAAAGFVAATLAAWVVVRARGAAGDGLWRAPAVGLAVWAVGWYAGRAPARVLEAAGAGAVAHLHLIEKLRVAQELIGPLPRLAVVAAAVAAVVWGAARQPRATAAVVLAVWLAAGVATFAAHRAATDSYRQPNVRFVRSVLAERGEGAGPPTVYWPCGRVEVIWLDLQSDSYFTLWQMAPSTFFRGLAVEGTRRWGVVSEFEVDRVRREFGPYAWMVWESTYDRDGPPSDAHFRALVADPAVDFAVLPYDYGGAVASNGSVWVYDCRALRASDPDRFPPPAGEPRHQQPRAQVQVGEHRPPRPE